MNVIITGSSGMVGRAALIECIESDHVKKILIINRSTINKNHPKVKEVIHHDFSDFTPIKDELLGYDACFHCMGVSAIGLSEDKYMHITYSMTKALATVLYQNNPTMVFIYVSGTGTDSSEKGRIMWARVKGKTENLILHMGFKDAYAFRPGMILPEKGVKSKTSWYNFMYVITRPFYPLFRKMKSVAPSSDVGKAMISAVVNPQELKHPENFDIKQMASQL